MLTKGSSIRLPIPPQMKNKGKTMLSASGAVGGGASVRVLCRQRECLGTCMLCVGERKEPQPLGCCLAVAAGSHVHVSWINSSAWCFLYLDRTLL